MGLDTECDLAIEAHEDDDAGISETITDIRNRLVAEHFGISADVLSDSITANQGRLAPAIDALRRDKGRSLRPFAPPQLSAAEKLIAESELLNSDRLEGMTELFKRNRVTLPGKMVAAGAVIVGLGLSWPMVKRLRRR